MDHLLSSAGLRLENLVAVVTGGSRGIGAGIVRRFVEEGARVVFSDLLDEKGKALKRNSAKTSHSNTQTLQVRPIPRHS